VFARNDQNKGELKRLFEELDEKVRPFDSKVLRLEPATLKKVTEHAVLEVELKKFQELQAPVEELHDMYQLLNGRARMSPR